MSSEVAFSFLRSPPPLFSTNLQLLGLPKSFPLVLLTAENVCFCPSFSCPVEYWLEFSLRQKSVKHAKLTHDISFFQAWLLSTMSASGYSLSASPWLLLIFFSIAYGCYLWKICSYGINSAIIRSGTSDLSILGSTPQECWERVRGEWRDKERNPDAAMRYLGKEDESSQQWPLWGKKRSYLRVPGSEISILQRNGQHLSLH